MSVAEGGDGGSPTGQETESGLDENVAGALSYVLGAITGVIFFVVDKENPFVRFHAAQSIVVSIGVMIVYIIFSVIGSIFLSIAFFGPGGFALAGLFSLLWLLLSLVVFGLWLLLIFKAYQGETYRLPIAADLADQLL